MKHAAILMMIMTIVSLSLPGCGSTSQDPSVAGSNPNKIEATHDHAESGLPDMDKMQAEMAKLFPEDAATVVKQHFCPVSGEMLGTMGAPIKMDVTGQSVWICCDCCQDQILENSDKCLAQLGQQ